VPALELVGAPIPPSRYSHIHWQPTPPPLQYGIDYTFAHRHGGEPVRWRRDSPIIVRIAGPSGEQAVIAPGITLGFALAVVLAELRALSGLNLAAGESGPAAFDPSAVPEQEIHVGYLPAQLVAPLFPRYSFPRCFDLAGSGGAALSADGSRYASGFAIINAGAGVTNTGPGQALAVLRHELAHALGLGHAGRRSLIMHYRITAGVTGYGRGDRHGLALVGRPPAPVTCTPIDRSDLRTPPCAV
jgi:hypothetical protein